jgi:hypothetical protein
VKITVNDDWWADEVKLADPAAEPPFDRGGGVGRPPGRSDRSGAIGDTEQTSREGWAKSHLGDRDSLDLVGEQQALFDALRALGKPIVVVLINGRPPPRWQIRRARRMRCSKAGIWASKAATPSPTSCSAMSIRAAICR